MMGAVSQTRTARKEAELWDAGHPELPEVPWQSAALAEVRAAKDHLLQEYQAWVSQRL